MEENPLVISPNIGCPQILSIKEIEAGRLITLIIAGQYGESTAPLMSDFDGTLYLRPSYATDLHIGDIPLNIAGEPVEITDWNNLSEFYDMESTREIINSELHYKVLGANTRYWKIKTSLKLQNSGYKNLLRKNGDKYLPALYDLIFRDRNKKWERVNYHSIQFVNSVEGGCRFIHLTDLHIAKRNDEIIDEVLKVKCNRGLEDIRKGYINFNDRLRQFIKMVNELADRGELDFIVITGDLVDFAFLGWEDELNPSENNWKTFISIITGRGKERVNGNYGIKVAIFTSTGNHDWRLHPYNPNIGSYNESFGLRKDELRHYEYRSFDSSEYPADRRAKLSEELKNNAFKKLNIDSFTDKWTIRFVKCFSHNIASWVMRVTAGLGITGAGASLYAYRLSYILLIGILGAVGWVIKRYLENRISRMVDFLIDNPLHAESKALSYYLRHINPYLDYAFKYGDHSFIVMDTGADVFVGQLLDGEEMKYIKKMSVEDNLLGGSPDSRAFDSEQIYCNWSQIVWLEKVMEGISRSSGGRVFIFLHAPPVNTSKTVDLAPLKERDRKGQKWIPFEECNLTYGTINHYLSQFFYLCMGYRESELVKEDIMPKLKRVNLVFSGHAHRNIEFRIDKDKTHNIRIYLDEYSKLLVDNNTVEWWKIHSPVIVQTAACGLHGEMEKEPPYFRNVIINNKGEITDFRVINGNGLYC